jgi:riboflavin biosynthesis pyrimidine reductase
VRQIFPPDAAHAEIGPAEFDPAGPGETGQAAPAAVMALAGLYAYPAGEALDRPWLRANMVVSVDGAASLVGRSGGLSGPADRLLFSVLRSLADVVLVGAATARAERYRPAAERAIWSVLRVGRAPTPPIAVVTRELSLDPDSPLIALAHSGSRTIVLTTAAAPDRRRAAVARHADVVVAGRDSLTPAAVISALAERGYRRLLTEGGPNLLGQFSAAGLLDELCLTISPLLEGGWAGRILTVPDGAGGPGSAGQAGNAGAAATGSAPWAAARLRLAHVLEDQGALLCRYLRDTG